MSNYCCGDIEVSGQPEDIEAFCKLFLFTGDKDKDEYFARSGMQTSWSNFYETHLASRPSVINSWVEFAWSAEVCLISGYPNGVDQITLVEACKKYRVDVIIDTQESGEGFEEHITCDKEGNLVYEVKDMHTYKCKCGNEQHIASNFDTVDEECNECEGSDWEMIK